VEEVECGDECDVDCDYGYNDCFVWGWDGCFLDCNVECHFAEVGKGMWMLCGIVVVCGGCCW